MLTYVLVLIAVIWMICGILAYGFTFAYFQREYPSIANGEYKNNLKFSLLIGLFGPFGLRSALRDEGYKHGLKFW